MVIRGMGQQFRFKLPYNSQYVFSDEAIAEVTVAIWQDGDSGEEYAVEVIKNKTDCTFNAHGTCMYVSLNEEESLAFLDDRKAWIQMKAKTTGGLPFGTKKRPFTVYPIYEGLV